MCLILTVHLPSSRTTAVFMFEFSVGTILGLVALSFGFPDEHLVCCINIIISYKTGRGSVLETLTRSVPGRHASE